MYHLNPNNTSTSYVLFDDRRVSGGHDTFDGLVLYISLSDQTLNLLGLEIEVRALRLPVIITICRYNRQIIHTLTSGLFDGLSILMWVPSTQPTTPGKPSIFKIN